MATDFTGFGLNTREQHGNETANQTLNRIAQKAGSRLAFRWALEDRSIMSHPAFHIGIFLLGCVGAIAPEVVRLYNLRTRPEFTWSWYYLVVSALFALLGGVVAWIMPATTYYGAFYAGVATPLVVSVMLKDRESPKQRMAQVQASSIVENQKLIAELLKDKDAMTVETIHRLQAFLDTHETTQDREKFLSELPYREGVNHDEVLYGMDACDLTVYMFPKKPLLTSLRKDYFRAL